jgi:acyl-CoA synthetase (AMP-forming)/AMP-acid ligase II
MRSAFGSSSFEPMTEIAQPRARTLAELLVERASTRDTARDFDVRLLYVDTDLPPGATLAGDDRALNLSFEDVLRIAQSAARALKSAGVEAGDRVLLLLPTSAGYLAAFFGCQLLGAIPVPLVPPWSLEHLQAHAARIDKVAEVCEARALVAEPSFLRLLTAFKALSDRLGRLPRVAPSQLFEAEPLAISPPTNPDEPAFIQFTSGSTAEPKGVVIRQGAVLENCRFIAERLEGRASDVAAAWLPLFHDMGLIGHLLTPLYAGVRAVLFPPEVFVRQPRVWLEVLTRTRATITTAPNFAYDLCAKKLTPRDLERIDLTHLRVAMCGGEPVLRGTLERFTSRFSGVGFKPESFRPVYGLAEATLAVTMPLGGPPRVDVVNRAALEQDGHALPATPELPAVETLDLVSAGKPYQSPWLRVVDDAGAPLDERRVGLIEVAGPSLLSAYFRNPEATAHAVSQGWLKTGDLGYVADGELFVVGRSKETIIKGGRSIHPYDIEAAASGVEGVRAGRVAAFGTLNEETATDDIVLVCETHERDAAGKRELDKRIRTAVFAATGARLDVLELTEPGSLSKTSSGKLQRHVVRERYLQHDLAPVRVPWLARARAYWALGMPRLRLGTRKGP